VTEGENVSELNLGRVVMITRGKPCKKDGPHPPPKKHPPKKTHGIMKSTKLLQPVKE